MNTRTAETESIRAAPSFRLLSEAETESILGDELLATLAGGRRRD
jgi:hypothetical protein